jgi:hypothetical protein
MGATIHAAARAYARASLSAASPAGGSRRSGRAFRRAQAGAGPRAIEAPRAGQGLDICGSGADRCSVSPISCGICRTCPRANSSPPPSRWPAPRPRYDAPRPARSPTTKPPPSPDPDLQRHRAPDHRHHRCHRHRLRPGGPPRCPRHGPPAAAATNTTPPGRNRTAYCRRCHPNRRRPAQRPRPGRHAHGIQQRGSQPVSGYGYHDAPTEVIRMLVNAIETGYMADAGRRSRTGPTLIGVTTGATSAGEGAVRRASGGPRCPAGAVSRPGR